MTLLASLRLHIHHWLPISAMLGVDGSAIRPITLEAAVTLPGRPAASDVHYRLTVKAAGEGPYFGAG